MHGLLPANFKLQWRIGSLIGTIREFYLFGELCCLLRTNLLDMDISAATCANESGELRE
jgi:hypothetical protein